MYDLENYIEHDLLTPEENVCNYYTVQQDNVEISKVLDEALSIIHFNSRSLKGNLEKIKELLCQLDKNFKVIAITESWLKDSDINDVQIDGYNMFYVNRVSKKEGVWPSTLIII